MEKLNLDETLKELLKNKEYIAPGEAIRRVRKARGIKQNHLSELAGISNSYLCDIEKNRVMPSFKIMEKIGTILVDNVDGFSWQFFLYFNYDNNVKNKQGD